MRAELYTDGGCSGNPGIGGYACVIRLIKGDDSVALLVSDFKEYTTNNHMELSAIVVGLRMLSNTDFSGRVKVTSDSSYCINAFTKNWIAGWRRNNFKKNGKDMPNRELWVELNELIKKFEDIEWVWVKGHNGHKYNEICDTYAVRSYQEKRKFFERIE